MRLFLIRGLVAIAWVAVFAAVSDSLTTGVAILLVTYPVIDLVASLIDARTQGGSARRLLLLNAGVSAVAAVAVAFAATGDIADVLVVLAVWAAVSGAAQIATAVRRRAVLGHAVADAARRSPVRRRRPVLQRHGGRREPDARPARALRGHRRSVLRHPGRTPRAPTR